MKLVRRALLLATFVGLLSGCAYPVSRSVQSSDVSAIYFTGNLEGAIVAVDGISAGPAIQYDGQEGVLVISFGTHKLDVSRNGDSILSRDIFVGRGQQLEIKI
jgi:hypothetical protein